jgi:hypothetical protein
VKTKTPKTATDAELARVQALLEAHEWRFAKTMPHNPHWYTLRKTWENDQDFIDVVHFIRAHGFQEVYPPGSKNRYTVCVLGGFKYWTMGFPCKPGPYNPAYDTILINRKPEPAPAP